jgi:large subunit ribosomal protein L6
MSRLSKEPIQIPTAVTITKQGDLYVVKGPKGELKKNLTDSSVSLVIDGNQIQVAKIVDNKFSRSLIGTYASHLKNMIKGVQEGYTKKLILEGVGYKMAINGKVLTLQIGFSHPVNVDIPDDLTLTLEKNNLTIFGIDKERVGWFSALVRSQKKPEPYKGKGIRYSDETILRKQGKKNG